MSETIEAIVDETSNIINKLQLLSTLSPGSGNMSTFGTMDQTTSRQRTHSTNGTSVKSNSGRKKSKSPKPRSGRSGNSGRRRRSQSSNQNNENQMNGHNHQSYLQISDSHLATSPRFYSPPNQHQKHIQFIDHQHANQSNGFVNRIIRNSQFRTTLRRRRSRSESLSHDDGHIVQMVSSGFVGGNRRGNRGQSLDFIQKPGFSNEFVCREIMDYYQRNRQSNEKYKSKQIMRQSLENTLKQSFPNYFINLQIIGSSTNGIGDNASTVDICVLARKKIVLPVEKETTSQNSETKTENQSSPLQTKVAQAKEASTPTGTTLAVESSPNKSEDPSKVVVAAADSHTCPFEDSDDISLKHIEKVLQSKNFASNIVLIPARVPVIKFRDNVCQLDVTLNLNQEVSIRNTQLIRDYAKMDWRFPQLAMIVKQWARENHINSAVDKSISPYSWTLMVIHYLQVVEPPVLPCLQKMVPQRYEIKGDLEEEINKRRQIPVKWHSKNQNTLKQLMKGLFRYFGYVLDYDQFIISVREGKVLNRRFCRTSSTSASNDRNVAGPSGSTQDDSSNAIQWNSLMCVEEPFTRSNATRSVHDPETFERIRELLRMSSNAIKGNRISLFNVIIDDLDFPNKY